VQSITGLSSALKNARKNAANSDDELSVFMSSLSGSQLSDSDFAETGQQVNLLTSTSDDSDDQLPLTYDPEAIAEYWGVRPVSVVSRVLQLGTISSKFIGGLLWDWATGQLKNKEVQRAIQIRQIVTSLGPAYIKLGQALSIRPDLLSPPAMKEMQKLCDKVRMRPHAFNSPSRKAECCEQSVNMLSFDTRELMFILQV
jgi:aarF domain-containing kinase